MHRDQRSVRALLLAVFVPVGIVLGVLAAAVLGSGGPEPGLSTVPTATTAPAGPVRTSARVSAAAEPSLGTSAPPAAAPAPAPPPPPAPPVVVPEPVPEPDAEWTPAGAERIDVGSGAQGATIFRPRGAAQRPGPVVVFLHGWVALDPKRYGPWIAHLVARGDTVIYPAYQTKPAYDTITPLRDLLAGLRTALPQVLLAHGRLVVAGHSAGAALAADYAAVANANGLPAPAAVFSIYPGRKLRHLPIPIPTVDLSTIEPGTPLLVYAGERDTAVGSGTAHQIVRDATHADVRFQTIRDDDVDDHSAPRRFDGTAQRTFWAPLDALVDATAPPASGGAVAP